jgi:hypothetical protein
MGGALVSVAAQPPDRATTRETVNMALRCDIDDVLAQLTRQRRWMAYYFGARDAPSSMAFTFDWRGSSCADVLLLRGEDDALAYRVPTDSGTEVLRPTLICWSYQGSALWTMRAVLSLHPPTHPQAPYLLYPAPNDYRIPNATTPQRLTIRPTAQP